MDVKEKCLVVLFYKDGSCMRSKQIIGIENAIEYAESMKMKATGYVDGQMIKEINTDD